MKATQTYKGERGTAGLIIPTPTMIRFFYHPDASNGTTSFVWNGVEYTGDVTVSLENGKWVVDESYNGRGVSFGRTDYKYNSYDANRMNYKNQEKVARYFEEIAEYVYTAHPEMFIEAAAQNKADKIANAKRDIKIKQEQIEKLQDEVAALFTVLDRLEGSV